MPLLSLLFSARVCVCECVRVLEADAEHNFTSCVNKKAINQTQRSCQLIKDQSNCGGIKSFFFAATLLRKPTLHPAPSSLLHRLFGGFKGGHGYWWAKIDVPIETACFTDFTQEDAVSQDNTSSQHSRIFFSLQAGKQSSDVRPILDFKGPVRY